MADIVRLRARRFNALYRLLTGGARAELPSPYSGSEHLRKDIGLSEQTSGGLPRTHISAHQTDPLYR